MEISYPAGDEVLSDAAEVISEERHSRLEPTIGPGQIWVIEQASPAALTALHRDALDRANVVLYDRALAPLVARVLPIGTYAEPLPADETAGDGAANSAISPRALQFAADGWSVVQLVPAHGDWRRRLRGVATTASRRNGGANLPLHAITTTAADRHRRWDGCLRDLAVFVDEFADDDFLTLIVGPLVSRHPSRGDAFTANGLAG